MRTEQYLAELLEASGGASHGAQTYAAEVLNYLGLEVMQAEDNLGVAGIIPGELSGVAVMLQTHTDTVPAGEGWHTNPYELTRVHGDRLQGRGTADALGAGATFLSLAAKYVERRRKPPISVIFEFVGEEETGGAGTEAMTGINRELAARFPYRGCLLGEPTDGAFAVSHNGADKYAVTFEGEGGHSSQHFGSGNTPPELFAAFVGTLSDKVRDWRTRYVDPEYALPAANLTSGRFGTESDNQVDSRGTARLDIRMPPSMIADRRQVLAELQADGITFECLSPDVPNAPHCPKGALIRRFITDVFPDIPQIGVSWASDMYGLQEAGWPTIHYSPFKTAVMHGLHEEINIEELRKNERMIRTIIPEFGRYAVLEAQRS